MNDETRNPASHANQWYEPDQVFDGRSLHTGKAVRVHNGSVSDLVDANQLPADAKIQRIAGTLSGGFFDIQVNGGDGVLLNTSPTPIGMRRVAAAHRQFGTTAILPTVITDQPDVMDNACDAISQAHGTDGLLGIHLEGPHISVARRGTHAERFVRPLDERTLSCVRRLRDQSIPVLLTLAPEAVEPGQVRELTKAGAVVSIGHSDCEADAARRLLDEGATLFTHLYNAMSQMQNRQPGMVGAAINSDAYCSIICDGIHVDDTMVGLAVRARPLADHMILISDAMPTVGGVDSFDLYGTQIRLVDGKLVNAEGSLAGAHTTMAASVARMAGVVGENLETCLRMAITNPAQLMGLADRFELVGLDVEDLVVIDDDFACSRFAVLAAN